MEDIIKVLKNAESELQKVISAAAEQGDYKKIDVARMYAVQLKEMQADLIQDSIEEKSNRMTTSNIGVETKGEVVTLKGKSKKNIYPKYKIDHNSLVRIGWSKKDKREYSHKVSKDIYDQTIETIEKLTKTSKGPFAAEAIIDNINKESQSTIPAYQVYVVIGFLKDKDCIKQIGREGYSIPNDIKILSLGIWNN